jgi:hypothetical protein
MSIVLLIDYENVQGINLEELAGTDSRVCIFTGSSQSKIPIELVSSAQVLGNRLEWIRIDGNGPNALDFHIAYYLGAHITKYPKNEYFVLSKDKGFDPLMKHIAKEKVACKRITTISELLPTKRVKAPDTDYEKVLLNLKKIEKSRRPKNAKTLKQHIKSIIGKTQTEDKLNRIIEQLQAARIVVVEDGRLKYEI